jgi:uncharacterized protein with HEPN domain
MKDDRLYLIHVKECIERVQQYIKSDKQRFLDDVMVQDAVLRNLQVMAESTQRISAELKARHAEVNWRRIAAFRNLLVHNYLGVNLERVWVITEQDVPDLKTKVERILIELGTA